MKGIDRFILNVFYLYVFMLPFENILEVQWGIDTPYRPYRLLAIGIGSLIIFSRRLNSLSFHQNDLKLLGIYLFGLIPSLIAWADNRLYLDSFWSSSIQFFIILWLVLLIKRLPLQLEHIYRCMNIYCIGVFFNSIFMIYTFFLSDMSRQSGWMDNPNYAAFTSCIAFSYLFYTFFHNYSNTITVKGILILLLSLCILLGLFLTGSRSAMIVLVISMAFILFHRFSWKKIAYNILWICFPILILFQFISFDKFVQLVPAWNRLIVLMDKEDSRTVLWKQGYEAFVETKCIGLGIEQFKNPDNYRKYVHKTENVSVAMQQGLVLHNDYLTVLFEYGMISFGLFISFYIFLYKRLRVRILEDKQYYIFFICFVNLAVFSMFLTSFQTHSMWFVYIMLGFIAYLNPLKNDSSAELKIGV